MTPFPLFLIMALAAYRITRLLTVDTILDTPRTWLYEQLESHRMPMLAELAGCPWCLGVHISILTVAVTGAFTSIPLPWLQMVGVAALVGLLSGRPEHG